jgi:hypothetical protein
MEKPLHNQTNIAFPSLKRVRQKSDYHCGPAVVTMLASYIHVPIKQHDIVLSAHVLDSYKQRGMTIEELATGFSRLHPEKAFWYKEKATIDDLDLLIHTYLYPVGVEWQGAFGQYADEDNGHYSVITDIDKTTNTITLSDPFYYFAGTDRVFPIDEFVSRWWDINEIENKQNGTTIVQNDMQMLFCITDAETIFEPRLGLKRYSYSL